MNPSHGVLVGSRALSKPDPTYCLCFPVQAAIHTISSLSTLVIDLPAMHAGC